MTQYSTESAVSSKAGQVSDQVREKAQVAQDRARGAFGQTRNRLRDQIDQRSIQAGDELYSAAQDVRSIAEQLRSQGKDTPAAMAEQIAHGAESFGSYLRNTDGERLLRDVEDLIRRNPWTAAGVGIALGFAGARFLKASSSRRYQLSRRVDYQSTGAEDARVTMSHRVTFVSDIMNRFVTQESMEVDPSVLDYILNEAVADDKTWNEALGILDLDAVENLIYGSMMVAKATATGTTSQQISLEIAEEAFIEVIDRRNNCPFPFLIC